MGVFCKILIRTPNEGVHRPGRPVDGIVKYAIDKPTEYKYVRLSLLGRGECSWTVTESSRNNESRTYRGTEDYGIQHIDIINKPNQTVILSTGSYEFPFQFILPHNIPSCVKNFTCTISYTIRLKFAKPALFSLSKVFQTELTVYSYVTPTSPEGPIVFGLEKSLFKMFSTNPKIKLKAEIDNTIYAPGENAKLSLEVTNDTDVPVKSVSAVIQCNTTYTADCGTTTEETDVLKESRTKAGDLTDKLSNISIAVPILLELYSIQNSKIMARNYNMLVTLKLPTPHVNAHVSIPLVIGERIPFEPQDLPDDEPPSYWEAVCEEMKIKE